MEELFNDLKVGTLIDLPHEHLFNIVTSLELLGVAMHYFLFLIINLTFGLHTMLLNSPTNNKLSLISHTMRLVMDHIWRSFCRHMISFLFMYNMPF